MSSRLTNNCQGAIKKFKSLAEQGYKMNDPQMAYWADIILCDKNKLRDEGEDETSFNLHHKESFAARDDDKDFSMSHEDEEVGSGGEGKRLLLDTKRQMREEKSDYISVIENFERNPYTSCNMDLNSEFKRRDAEEAFKDEGLFKQPPLFFEAEANRKHKTEIRRKESYSNHFFEKSQLQPPAPINIFNQCNFYNQQDQAPYYKPNHFDSGFSAPGFGGNRGQGNDLGSKPNIYHSKMEDGC
mmetsp:Transcript_1955/g.3400  ORF Transcript_1955/g.3400 Transcript_1955/m.3400 type:complete len:242 (+) Transcript_1955:1185-1910(+)